MAIAQKHYPLCLVLTTEKDFAHASNLARTLLRQKHAACISLRELNSFYWWEGEIEENKEFQLIIKTSKSNLSKLFLDVKRLHSYKIPEILSWEISSEKDYECWIRDILK